MCGVWRSTRAADVQGAEKLLFWAEISACAAEDGACRRAAGCGAVRFVRDLVFPRSFDDYLVFGPISS